MSILEQGGLVAAAAGLLAVSVLVLRHANAIGPKGASGGDYPPHSPEERAASKAGFELFISFTLAALAVIILVGLAMEFAPQAGDWIAAKAHAVELWFTYHVPWPSQRYR